MITVTVGQILNAENSLMYMSQQKMPAIVSYKIARLLSKLREESQHIETTRNNLIQQHAEKNENGEIVYEENGNPKFIDGDNFMKEFTDFLYSEISFDSSLIPLSVLDTIELTPQDVELLLPFLEEE